MIILILVIAIMIVKRTNIGVAVKRTYGRFPYFQSSNFQFESLKSEQNNCGYFLTRCRISMCQGLGPKKHDEISEIDRI